MDTLFLAQTASAPNGPGFFMTVIQQTLSKLLSTGGLTGWVNTVLPAFQFVGFIVCTVSLTRRFMRQKENPAEMLHVVVAMVITLWMVGQPRYIFGIANKAASSIMPAEFQATWGPNGTFTPPTIVKDISKQLRESIAGPAGASSAGLASDATQQYHWYKFGVDRLVAGVKGLDPRLLIAQAVTSVVEFFADSSLFILAVMYLVMALIMEINLLVFPAMIALYHTEMFGSSSREFCKHCIAVFLWPLGWGIGLLSAEGVMGGMATVDGTISGIIAFALSLFLVCFWLVFAATAGPVLFHKLVTQGASIGQGLMAGGLGGGGAMAVGATGWGAGMTLKKASQGLGSAVSALGSGVGKMMSGGDGGWSGSSGSGSNRTNADDAGSRSSLVRSFRGARDSGDNQQPSGGSGSSGCSSQENRGGTQSKRSSGEAGSGGGGESSNSGSGREAGGGPGGGGEKPGIVGRMRRAVGKSIAAGSGAVGRGMAVAGETIGGTVNGMAARGAMKLDQASDAFAEVGGAPVSSFKGNNHALRRRAEAPILPFPKPLMSDTGGGGGSGANQARPSGGRPRAAAAAPNTPQNGDSVGGGNNDAIEGDWELVKDDRPKDRGDRRRP